MDGGSHRLSGELDRALRRHAREYRRRYPGRTLETSDFVDRAQCKIFQLDGLGEIKNADALARSVLRGVLVDALRSYFADKRGGKDRKINEASDEDGTNVAGGDTPHELLAARETALSIASALASFRVGGEKVAKRIPPKKRDRMFNAILGRIEGRTNDEIAADLAVAPTVVQDDISFLRAYLKARLPDLVHVI